MVGGGLLEDGKMWSFAMDQSPGGAGEGSGEGRSPCVHRQPPPDTMLPSLDTMSPLHRRPKRGSKWIQYFRKALYLRGACICVCFSIFSAHFLGER